MSEVAARIWPVILSGGSGTRLWPLSRAASPKQLLALAGPDTMIVTTARRVADPKRFHRPMVVTGAAHAATIREQLGPAATLLIEPQARNTAPAIALALLAIERLDPDGLVLVMPSDHRVAVPAVLLAGVAQAAAVARDGWLMTFGIRAATPETGFGYIRSGEIIGEGVRRAESFIEKPDRERALGFVGDGRHSWNSGIFLFSVAAMRAALAAHAPAVLAAAEAAMGAATTDPAGLHPDAAAFAASPSISIDHAVFEHAARIGVCPVDPGWSDIGSWDALHGLGGDAEGNVIDGRVATIETRGCLLRAEGTLLTAIGVNNLNIVATPDAVLVTARGRSQEVRDLVSGLAGDPLLARPAVTRHPWGEERLVHEGGVGVRKLAIGDGKSVEIDPLDTVLPLSGSVWRGSEMLPAGQLTAGGGVLRGENGAVVLVIAAPAPSLS